MIEDKIFVRSNFYKKKKKKKQNGKFLFFILADTFVGGNAPCWGLGRSPEIFFFLAQNL
jgi:hypothetical protein